VQSHGKSGWGREGIILFGKGRCWVPPFGVLLKGGLLLSEARGLKYFKREKEFSKVFGERPN